MLLKTIGRLARKIQRVAWLSIIVSSLSACSTLGQLPWASSGAGPSDSNATAGAKSVDISPAVRCMDNLLADYGVRDMSVLVEDLADPQRQFTGGNRELLVSVLSQLTQRSRAIRLVASSKDWGNTAKLLTEVSKREPFSLVPQYALRGSLFAQDKRAVLGVNLTLLATNDMTVVPNMTSRNTLQMLSPGRAKINKLGLTFALAAPNNERALHQLLQISSIELIGRLTRVPYWACLGADNANPTVASEQQDWYDSLAARPVDLIRYFQQQMRVRGIYDGPLDGGVNESFKESVSAYREVLGLSREPQLSLDFFQAYLAADHQQLATKISTVATAPGQNVAGAPVDGAPPVVRQENLTALAPGANAPLSLTLIPSNGSRRYSAGQAVKFVVRPSRTAHIYCFLQDENGQILRIFPSRFQSDSRVTVSGVQLPGQVPFEIRMNLRGSPETVACYATDQDVLPRLPGGLNAGDLTPLPAASLKQVREAFATASGGAIAHEALLMQPRGAVKASFLAARGVAARPLPVKTVGSSDANGHHPGRLDLKQ